MHNLTAIVLAGAVCVLTACGSTSEAQSGATTEAPAASTNSEGSLDPSAADAARCHVPDKYGYGFEPGRCADIERISRVGKDTWRLQARLVPDGVYCADLHLGEFLGDPNLDVEGVGSLWEVRCPPSAYPDLPPADLEVAFESAVVDEPGVAMLTAVGPETQVVVDANADRAWIRRGTCDDGQIVGEFHLRPFFSFRSISTVPVALESLTSSPWVIQWDSGGAHGGEPLACAELRASTDPGR